MATKTAKKTATRPPANTPKLDGFRLRATLGATGLKHNGAIRGIVASSDGAYFASAGDGTNLHLWDPSTGEAIADIAGSDRGVYALALSHDARLAFVGGHEMQIIDVAKRKRVGELPVKTPLVMAIASSPCGVVLYGDDRRPRRFDVKTSVELPPLKGHLSRLDACALSSDGTIAITGGGDRKIKIHAILGPKKPAVIATLEGYSKSCGVTPDQKSGWSVGWDHAFMFDVDPASNTLGKQTWVVSGGGGRKGALPTESFWPLWVKRRSSSMRCPQSSLTSDCLFATRTSSRSRTTANAFSLAATVAEWEKAAGLRCSISRLKSVSCRPMMDTPAV